MLRVSDILGQAKKVLGKCDNATVFEYLGEAQDILTDRLLSDATLGYIDIVTDRDEITLPDDIEAPLAVNIGGQPADYRNRWFEFHLNGPGSGCSPTAGMIWSDLGYYPTFRSIKGASTLRAISDANEGPNVNLRVYGFTTDASYGEKWIMTPNATTGVLEDGFNVLIGTAGVVTTQSVTRITRVSKPVTSSFVNLFAVDPANTAASGITLLGYFKPGDTEPMFRRLKLSGAGCDWLCNCQLTSSTNTWVRMRFKKKNTTINDLSDLLFVDSLTALKKTLQAIKKYENDLLDEYEKYVASAVNDIRMKKKAQNGPNQIKIQFQRAIGSTPYENMS